MVQPDSVLSINATEGYALEDFSIEAVNSQISEAQKIAGGSGSEQDIAEAKIELEVSHSYGHKETWLTLNIGSRESTGCVEVDLSPRV